MMLEKAITAGAEAQYHDNCILFFIPDRLRRLAWLGSLVMSLHTGTSFLEERLFKSLKFTSAFFMVLVMCVIYIAGYLAAQASANRGSRDGARRPVFQIGNSRGERLTMAALCLAYVGSNALSKLSLNYVTVPLMCVSLSRSCARARSLSLSP